MSAGDCGVCLGGYDGDGPEFSDARMVLARREHKCYDCQRPIAPGIRYERVTGKWEGQFLSHAFCVDCVDIATSLSCDGSREFGNLWGEIEEYVFPALTTGCLAKLQTASAKAYLLERWRKWKGLP